MRKKEKEANTNCDKAGIKKESVRETVEEACMVHGIDVDKLLALVNEEANKPVKE